jgi:hypothetical protein
MQELSQVADTQRVKPLRVQVAETTLGLLEGFVGEPHDLGCPGEPCTCGQAALAAGVDALRAALKRLEA